MHLILRKHIILIVIFLYSIFQGLPALANSASGLLFKSNNELIDHRTSLDLFDGTLKKFENSFSLSFDISVWDTQRFGYVLRIIDEYEKEMSLVFVNFKGGNNLYFDFNYTDTGQSIQLPVLKKDLVRGKWLHIEMDFDLKGDGVEIRMQNETYSRKDIALKPTTNYKFIFGLYGTNLDVPEMAVRNIEIKENEKPRYYFPLNEASGEKVHDSKGKAIGRAKNPVWIINRHHTWQPEVEFPADCTAGITLNSRRNEIVVVNKDSVSNYHLINKAVSHRKLSEPMFTINSGEAIYNHAKNKCYVYNLNEKDTLLPSFGIINMRNLEVEYLGNPILRNRLHHHNAFFSAQGDSLFIFGGYGNFSYSNDIFYFDQENTRWKLIEIQGDEIFPRFFSATGPYRHPWEQLIFGGFGNRSGKQEMGGKNLYDLFALDTRTMTFTKQWENKELGERFVPCSNLVVDANNEYFYTLCYPHHIAATQLQLYRFSIADGSYEVVSSELPILSEKINTTAYLFYEEELNEFQAVVREYVDENTSTVRIYSLLSPPITMAELQEYKVKSPTTNTLFILSVIAVMGILFFLFRRKKKQENTTSEKLAGEAQAGQPGNIRKRNAIYVLGDFTAFDMKGTDISYRFSTKLRHIFALLLCNSINGKEGISTEKLSSDLWPEKEIAETKNIRGVTINHLRNILKDMDTIELVYKNAKWYFEFSGDFYCDYSDSISLAQNLLSQPAEVNEEITRLSTIIKRGKLFPTIQTVWTDQYKHDYEELMEKTLKPYLSELYEQGDYNNVVKLADIFFTFDPLNEKALVLAVKSLRKLGKIEKSQNLYNRFSARYKESMGEDYKQGYSSVWGN